MEKNKLRIGLLLGGFDTFAWSHKMIEAIKKSGYAEIDLIVLNAIQEKQPPETILSKLKNNSGQIFATLIRKVLVFLYHQLIERKRNTALPDSRERIDCEVLLRNVPKIEVVTIRKNGSDYFYLEDVKAILSHKLDILVQCGFGLLRGEVLSAAKHGVWSFCYGDYCVNKEAPVGYWESTGSRPETESILRILTENLDNGVVLYRSFSGTKTMSLQDNKSNCYRKALYSITRKMKELYETGEKEFFKNVEYGNRHPAFDPRKHYEAPTVYELTHLTFRKILEKLRIFFDKRFYFNQWILLFDLKNEFASSLCRYQKMIPPKDRFWADPHILYQNNRYYIFIEEYLYRTQKGHISLIVMDEDGVYSEPTIILDKPYHLSYPFVFEHDNECYMIPESRSNKTIELYKCVVFPHQWEFCMNLMENVEAVDTTVYYDDDRWWLFVNMVENKGECAWDELFLWSASELQSSCWEPHPQNPIVSDCKTARPAGKIFSKNGRLYRPSQNCSKSYGYGYNISEITSLNQHSYEEEIVSRVTPDWDKDIIGTHTFNRINNLHIIDALYKRRLF